MFPLLRSQVPAARRSIAALSKCQRHRRLGHFGRLFTSSTIQSANSISGHRRRWLQMTPSSHLHQQHGDFVQHREHGPIFVSREVWEAISSRSAVVALESTIITHGMTFPANLETALQVESIIRQNGSVPATIGIIDGNVFVGLQPQQLEQLAQKGTGRQGRTVKVSRSDLPVVVASGWCGGTTVSATSYLANLVGIRVFVTGGIGGVHRGAEVTMDISADLSELARTPITVVSAGVKSILDIGKTLEVLETNGVCVAVYQGEEDNATGQVKFPAFFTPDSGISVAYNLKTATAVAKLMHSRDALQLESAILLAVPNESKEGREYHRKVEEALELAQREMREQGIQGKKVTPFLLARISELTGGESLKLNQQLIEHNALVGAQISREYSRLGCPASPPPPPSNRSPSGLANKTGQGSSSSGPHQGKWSNAANKLTASDLPTGAHSSPSTPVVIGGSIYDIVTKAHGAVQLDGSTYHGSLQTSLGGVARNIADCIFKLGQEECLLITAVGKDLQGQLVRQNNPNAITSGIRMVDDLPTSACAVTIDGNGECVLLVGDMRVHQHIDRDFVSVPSRSCPTANVIA